MNKFVAAARGGLKPEALTQNGAATFATSQSPLVDLFFLIGSLSKGGRGSNSATNVSALFNAAFAVDPEKATRTMLWARDVRGGQGRRQVFRDWLHDIERSQPELCALLIPFVPVYGRWDDLLVFSTEQMRLRAFKLINEALNEGHGLAAKWMPRKGKLALALAKSRYNFRYREQVEYPSDWTLLRRWRRDVARLSKTVETQMSAKAWGEINYDHVPGLAMTRYRKAFGRHDYLRFSEWIGKLKKQPAKKMNVETLYPFNIVSQLGLQSHGMTVSYSPRYSMDRTGDALLEEQWKRLPNYLNGKNILAIVDVSGSMGAAVQGTVKRADISVSLGLYLAEKNTGAFKDVIVNFSSASELVVIDSSASLRERANQVTGMKWGQSTNLQAAFDNILNHARKNRVPQEDMPEYLLILSDMEFNSCGGQAADTNLNAARVKFESAGYRVPKIVFWNVSGHNDKNVPARAFESDVALVSGFSPSIMTSILGVKDFNPEEVMEKAIMKDRYNVWEVDPTNVPKA